MSTENLKELRNALSCWQDDYDRDHDKEQYDMFGAAIDAVARLEAAERERDELRAEQAEHDEQIARMEGKFSLAKRALDSKTARCDRAEAELRRRDAAAGEPVAWLNDAYLGRGVIDGEAGKEDQGPGYIPVYRAPQPAALAPEYHTAMKKLRHTLANCNRLNYCAEALKDVEKSLALGAQQQKVVAWHNYQWRETPKGWTWWLSESFAPKKKSGDGWKSIAVYLSEEPPAGAVGLPALDAAGVKWEVKK